MTSEPSFLVSITTSPRRLQHMKRTLRTLTTDQELQPTCLLINVPTVFERTGELYDEKQLAALTQVHPCICINRLQQDYGPASKLAGAALHLLECPDPGIDRVVYCDDDIAYQPQLLSSFAAALSASEIGGHKGFFLTGRKDVWFFPSQPGPVQIIEGFAGVCVPHALVADPDLVEYIERWASDPLARTADDVVLSYWFSQFRGQALHQLVPESPCVPLDYGLGKDALHTGSGSQLDNFDRYAQVQEMLERARPPTSKAERGVGHYWRRPPTNQI
jgi:hypothetical protein